MLVVALACGGGGSNNTPTTPVDNAVARVDVSPSAPLSLFSGTTASLTAAAFTRDGRALGATGVTWSSSDSTIASVAGGVVTAKLVGSASITAQISGVSSAGVAVVVSPGAAAQLGLRTAPAGAASGLALSTPPVVEVRDAAGNAVPTSTVAVSVALASGGGALTGPSTVSAVAGVATFGGLVITGTVGARTLAFSAPGVTGTASAPFTLAPGTAVQLFLRTPPVAGTAYAAFATPAVVEVHDGADNVVTSSTASVTAQIASGGGAVGGAATVAAVAGVATFSTLTINGSAGARTLTFTSAALAGVTTASFDVAAAPPAVIAFSPAAPVISVGQGSGPGVLTMNVTNAGVFPLTNLRVQGISYNPIAPTGWLAATFTGATSAPAPLRLTATITGFAIGTYTAVVQIAGDGATVSPAPLTVTLQVGPSVVLTYGQAATKTSIVNVGASVSPAVSVTDGAGASTTDNTLAFFSRAPGVATVDATGKVTGVAAGETWVAATSQRASPDSVFVIVPRSATDPILRTDLTQFSWRAGDTVTARIILDTRSATRVGAVTAQVSWTNDFASGALNFVDLSTANSTVTPAVSVDNAIGIIRLNAASAAGVTGVIELARVRFTARLTGRTGWIYLGASELIAPDLTDLLPLTTLTQFPVIVR